MEEKERRKTSTETAGKGEVEESGGEVEEKWRRVEESGGEVEESGGEVEEKWRFRRPNGKGVRPGTLEVFKLFYHGVDGKRNGVGVILKEEYSKSVVEVKRVSDRVMIVKLEVKGMMINVISASAPQVCCEMEEKERFWMVMDRLTDEVRQESPWTMMFADDIVICGESREQVEKSLERWRYALERRGMKLSRSKTEYMCVNEREGSGVVRLQGEDQTQKLNPSSFG
ncbi:hypothetical protein C0J45_21105 [Silurus meridionalis]|nr:hypothetical protein C0J45_21105 [Silurus meridionalis]